jgi:molybdopterin/thiamine biosynthesis adenylyltransferase
MRESDNRRFAKNIGVAADVFNRPVVTLELPLGQEERPEAVSAFMLAANLLNRLFTKVYLVAPDAPLGPNPWQLTRLSELPDSLAGVSEGDAHWGVPDRSDIVLGVGAPPSINGDRRSFFTFNGWLAGLEQDVGSDQSGLFGALFAACYGAAQCFLHAATATGADYQKIEPFRISLLSYDFTDTNAPIPTRIDFREAHLVGVGAVGSAFVYVLAHLPGCDGLLHLIDNDGVDDPNLERYILMRKRDVTRKKTEVAEEALRAGGPRGVSHPVNMQRFQTEAGYKQDLLITPVDSELGRRKLATGLPRAVLNGATGGTNVTVSRHGFADGKACLHCLYLPQIDEVTTEKRLATDMQLPLEEVEALMASNEGVSEELVRRVEKNLGFEAGKFQQWVGKHIQSFYQRAVCGEAQVNTPSGTIVSPLSFISAAAGVLLAAEFVKMHTPELSRFALDNFFRADTLHAPKAAFRQTKPQDATKRCICWDRDYVETYRDKFTEARVSAG